MLMNSNEYLNIVESIKQDIRTAQYRATVSVNRELLVLYHSIGKVINEHKTWGNKFVKNLAADIKMSFPDATGYSVRNPKYMAKFALRFPEKEIVQAALAIRPPKAAIRPRITSETNFFAMLCARGEKKKGKNRRLSGIKSGPIPAPRQ